MAIKLTTTKQNTKVVKLLVYGKSGVGKTYLSSTAESPVIVSSEKKMLSLKDHNIPVILVESADDLSDAYDLIIGKKGAKFKTVVLDSVTDIAEAILNYYKANPKDGNTHPQAPYGWMIDDLDPLIKKFRDIPDKNVYVIAKAQYIKDGYTEITSWSPKMPGQQMGPNLPYAFDLVFAMRTGEDADGNEYRYLQTEESIDWLAKGIKGLNKREQPNLKKLFAKILGTSKGKEKPKKEEGKGD